MAVPVWPASLPQALITDGYGQQAPSTIIATQMDVGPGKRRRRTSAGVQPVQGQIVVTEEQLEMLREFFHKDLGDGALRFRWIDPVSSPNPAGDARMVLDGSNGTYASTPHSAAVDITGDLTLVARATPDTDAAKFVLSKMQRLNEGSWALGFLQNGSLQLWTTTPEGESINLALGFVPLEGGAKWVAITIEPEENAMIRSFYKDKESGGWVLLESVQRHLTQMISTTNNIVVGGRDGNNFNRYAGKVYRAQVWEGAGFDLNSGPTGTLVADFNPSDAPRSLSAGGNFTSSATGEVWTLHGNATIHNPTVGVPVEMRFTEPPQWSARTSGIYTVSLALEILP